MSTPFVSIIIPTHNGERWLEATLRSLAVQDDKDFECIIIDSSAADTTLDIARRFGDELNLQLHRRPDIVRWTDKTNLGAELASAEYICNLHQDDLWLPHRAARLRQWISNDPDVTMHLSPSLIVGAQGQTLGQWNCPLAEGPLSAASQDLLERLLVQNFIAMPAPAFKRSAFSGVGGMDTDLWYTADWDLYLKLALQGSVFYHDELQTSFRVHGQSLTLTGSRTASDFRQQMETVLARYANHLPAASATKTLRMARASIDINVALAAANNGTLGALAAALASLIRLGPVGIAGYLRNSRIIERVWPRLRARIAGGL
jgi:hypothetical protein